MAECIKEVTCPDCRSDLDTVDLVEFDYYLCCPTCECPILFFDEEQGIFIPV